MTSTLSQQQIQQFIEDGFIRVEEAFPRLLADQGRELLWNDMQINPLARRVACATGLARLRTTTGQSQQRLKNNLNNLPLPPPN